MLYGDCEKSDYSREEVLGVAKYLYDEIKLPTHDLESCIFMSEKTEPLISTVEDDISTSPEHGQPSRVDILYDIFFVSALSLFTCMNKLDNSIAIWHFITFFTTVWTVWYQVTLYRTRLAVGGYIDSLLQACQFLLMYLFAASAISYVNEAEHFPFNIMIDSFACVVVYTKFILTLQYVWALWNTLNDNLRRKPISLILKLKLTVMVLNAFISISDYRALWYGVIALKTMADTIICTRANDDAVSRVLDIYQRMSNLTLVILGAGIIALAKACFSLGLDGLSNLNMLNMSDINCFVLTIYFVYALYSSQSQPSNATPVRGALWTLLHFPLYLGLALGLAALATSIIRDATLPTDEDFLEALNVVLKALGAAPLAVGLLHLCSKPTTQLSGRETTRIALLVTIGVATMFPLSNFAVSEAYENSLASWALPVVVLSLAAVLLIDEIWKRISEGPPTRVRDCRMASSLSWWASTGALESWH